ARREVTPASPLIDPTNVSRLEPAWTTQIAGAGASAPVVADGILYVAADSGELHAIDAATGELRWIGRTQVGALTSPVVSDGRVFIHVGSSVFVFDVACGTGGATCEP